MIKLLNVQLSNDQQVTQEKFETFLEIIKIRGIDQAIQDAIIQATIAGNWHKVSQLADFAIGIGASSTGLSKSVDEDDTLMYLELPKRITKALENQGIITVANLIEWTFEELLIIKGIRASSAQKIAVALEKKTRYYFARMEEMAKKIEEQKSTSVLEAASKSSKINFQLTHEFF